MKKQVFFATLSMIFLLLSFTLKPTGKGYDEIHYGDVDPMETEDYTVTLSDMHSQETFCLIRAEVKNKTKDYLFIDLGKVKFTLPNGNSASPVSKRVKISPEASKKITIKSQPTAGLPAESLKVELEGISRLPVNGSVEEVEAYPLPDTKKKVESKNLSIALTSLKKETRVTQVKWKVENKGESPILVNSSLLTATCKGNDGEWSCESTAKDYQILWPGQKVNVKAEFRIPGREVDMQFANMLIHWNKAYISSKEVEVKGVNFQLEMDLGKTEGMNK